MFYKLEVMKVFLRGIKAPSKSIRSCINLLDPGDMDFTTKGNFWQHRVTDRCILGKIWLKARMMGK